MRRFGLLCLGACLGLALAGPALAQGCGALTPASLAAGVPYLGQAMRAEAAPDGSIAFAHVDDARLRLTLALSPGAVPDPGQRRSEFLADRRRELDADAARFPAGTTVRTSVGFTDPVSWTIQARAPAGDDVSSRGLVTVKLRPGCDMRIGWDVLETPNLVSRIKDITAAIDALRDGPGHSSVPSAFAPENSTPTGMPSLVLGILAPLLAAGGFAYVFRSMARTPRPHPRIRAAAAAAALAALAGLALQAPVYAAHLPALRYTDNAGLLGLSAALLAGFAATGFSPLALAALAMALSAGVTLGVQAYLGWAPVLEVTVALSLALTAVGGFGTWAWGAFPVRTKPAARAARPARMRAA